MVGTEKKLVPWSKAIFIKLTGLPILGKLPVLSQHLLDEFNSLELAEITEANIDIDRILSLAGGTVK